MKNSSVETIVDGKQTIALIVRAGFDKPGLHFFTPPSFSQQLAVMRHPAGKRIAAHSHKAVSRRVLRTQEVLLVRKGKVRVTLYSAKRERLCARVLSAGDLILLCGGGHGFQMLEETTMVEIKQGPYAGDKDKVVFEHTHSA